MPAISRFFGIVIKMYFSDHNPPHFHPQYGEQAGLLDIATLQMIEGDLSARPLKMIQEWAAMHQRALLTMWNSKEFQRLPGLE
jgi:uncharacterized protein DUF4160